MGKQYYIYLLLGPVILPILGLTFIHFHRFLFEDAIVIKKVINLIFYNLAYNVFSLLALVLKIKAFLAYTLGTVILIAFLPIIYKYIFLITITGTALVLKFIFLLSLTSLSVALYLYLNTFSLYLRHLSSSLFISN
jgi:hypothetical protein